MLDEQHRRRGFAQQGFNLNVRVDVDVIERLVPHIQVRTLAAMRPR